MGDIPHIALGQIKAADVVIALVVEPNSNVAYEVTTRKEGNLPVVLVGDWPDIPLYVQDLARQNWTQSQVLARIETIVADEGRLLPDFTIGIPDDLKAIIDSHDAELQKGLEAALQEIEPSFRPHPIAAVEHLRGILSDETENFYPCSVVEIHFSGKNDVDPQRPATVTDFDDRFGGLYGYGGIPSARADKPLTLTKLLDRIKGFVDPRDWDEFMKDQQKLTDVIIKTYGYAKATVPLRINQNHTNQDYAGKSYLPCVVAQVNDGDRDGPHTMYLLVEYIEVPATFKPR